MKTGAFTSTRFMKHKLLVIIYGRIVTNDFSFNKLDKLIVINYES